MIDYIYRVRQYDTIESIAQAFGVPSREIIAINNISNIREGDRLIILKKPQKTHMVKPNESLYEIAKKYGKDVDEIKKLNDIDYIYTGLSLVIER